MQRIVSLKAYFSSFSSYCLLIALLLCPQTTLSSKDNLDAPILKKLEQVISQEKAEAEARAAAAAQKKISYLEPQQAPVDQQTLDAIAEAIKKMEEQIAELADLKEREKSEPEAPDSQLTRRINQLERTIQKQQWQIEKDQQVAAIRNEQYITRMIDNQRAVAAQPPVIITPGTTGTHTNMGASYPSYPQTPRHQQTSYAHQNSTPPYGNPGTHGYPQMIHQPIGNGSMNTVHDNYMPSTYTYGDNLSSNNFKDQLERLSEELEDKNSRLKALQELEQIFLTQNLEHYQKSSKDIFNILEKAYSQTYGITKTNNDGMKLILTRLFSAADRNPSFHNLLQFNKSSRKDFYQRYAKAIIQRPAAHIKNRQVEDPLIASYLRVIRGIEKESTFTQAMIELKKLMIHPSVANPAISTGIFFLIYEALRKSGKRIGWNSGTRIIPGYLNDIEYKVTFSQAFNLAYSAPVNQAYRGTPRTQGLVNLASINLTRVQPRSGTVYTRLIAALPDIFEKFFREINNTITKHSEYLALPEQPSQNFPRHIILTSLEKISEAYHYLENASTFAKGAVLISRLLQETTRTTGRGSNDVGSRAVFAGIAEIITRMYSKVYFGKVALFNVKNKFNVRKNGILQSLLQLFTLADQHKAYFANGGNMGRALTNNISKYLREAQSTTQSNNKSRGVTFAPHPVIIPSSRSLSPQLTPRSQSPRSLRSPLKTHR
jgi:flagellar biosynthesis GTPase FlhF